MGRRVTTRLAFALFLVFAVSSASLLLASIAPGDYVIESLGPGVKAETAARARERYGLDRSVGAQYFDWLKRAVHFDFGRSLAYDRPVAELIAERALNTALLAVVALLVATLIGLPLGVVSGSQAGWLPTLVRATSLAFVSAPPLLTSITLVFLAARTGWFPISGMRSASGGGSLDVLWHMVVPVLALALPIAASFERLQAQALSETLRAPFVVAAIGRGVPRGRIVWRDGLKAALTPVVAMYGLVIGSLLSGSFVVEMVTAWPGLGRLMLDALRARDPHLVAGCAATGAAFLALGTLLSDAAATLVNPRAAES